MLPAYRDGDKVVIDTSAYVDLLPQPGDVVLAAHPFYRDVRMIKRVDHVTADRRVFVVGDNPRESTDSRSWGALRPCQIIGKVIGNTG